MLLCVHCLTLKLEALYQFKTSVTVQSVDRCNIPDLDLSKYNCQNLRSCNNGYLHIPSTSHHHPTPSGQLLCFCIFYSLYYRNKLFLTISIQTSHVSCSATVLTATGWRWGAMLHKRQHKPWHV